MTDRQIITIQTWVFEKTNTWILANEQRLFLQGRHLTVFAAATEIQASKNIRIWENLHLYCISHGLDRRQKLPSKERLHIKNYKLFIKIKDNPGEYPKTKMRYPRKEDAEEGDPSSRLGFWLHWRWCRCGMYLQLDDEDTLGQSLPTVSGPGLAGGEWWAGTSTQETHTWGLRVPRLTGRKLLGECQRNLPGSSL